jgi:YggT family protein
MKFSISVLSLAIICLASLAGSASASVFLPYTAQVADPRAFSAVSSKFFSKKRNDFRSLIRQNRASPSTAMAIPGNGVAEQVFVGGFSNFLNIYNLIITARVLLSWFPQAQGVAALQPVYAITDPYLNIFRGLIPPIFGLDLSILPAFFLLNVLTNSMGAVGCDLPQEKLRELRLLQQQKKSPAAVLSRTISLCRRKEQGLSMNL